VDIPVEIYRYKTDAKDDLYEKTKKMLLSKVVEDIASDTGLRVNYVVKLLEALENPNITQLNQLAHVDGIGIKTLEKLFSYAKNNDGTSNIQNNLF